MPDWLRRAAPIIAAAALGLVVVVLLEPVSRSESHIWKVALCVVTIGLVLWRAFKGEVWLRTWRFVATAGVVLGAGAYYNFDRDFAEGMGDYTDAAYYYLNSKYFDELGYFGLYEGILLADAEGADRMGSELKQVRNLRDYELEPAAVALERAPQVKARFTPARWEAFRHDAEFFLAKTKVEHLKRNFFVDHGYNPPPPWTLVGGTLSSLVPVEHVKVAAMVDVGLVVLMFVAIGWALGVDALLLALLFWFCTLSGRWPVMGHSILRFDWVAGVVIGICALRRGRTGLGGAALAWATMSRVIPAVFWGCAALALFVRALRERSIPGPLRGFSAGTVLMVGLVGGLSLLDVGLDGYRASVANLRMHDDAAEAYSSQKVGFGDAVFFRGETTREAMAATACGFLERRVAGVDCDTHGDAVTGKNKGNGIAGKGVLVHSIRPLLRVLGGLVLALIAANTWRRRRDPEDLVHLGLLLIFVLTTPSYYYFTIRIVLVLYHLAWLHRRRDQVGLVLLFTIEAISNWTMLLGWQRYATTALLSWMLLGYFAWLVGSWRWKPVPSGAEACHPLAGGPP